MAPTEGGGATGRSSPSRATIWTRSRARPDSAVRRPRRARATIGRVVAATSACASTWLTSRQRAAAPNRQAGKIQKEGSIHVSNVMFYAEKIKRPVRLKHRALADGKKVRVAAKSGEKIDG